MTDSRSTQIDTVRGGEDGTNGDSTTDICILKELVAQLDSTLCHPIDCSPPGSSVHGILQARILEWVAIFSSRGPS